VDVLFLDIHMPGLSGFQVVERVPPGPMVVFTWSAAATSPPAEGSARPSTAWPATSGPARSSTTSPRGCGTAST
jgi:DNA-binding LytR/AlgR family response regulator